MPTTVRKLITGSLQLINVVNAVQNPSQSDMNVSLDFLNSMVDAWSNESLMIYSVDQNLFLLNSGQQVYTLGDGGDWNIARPMEIQQAYFLLNPTLDLSDPVNPVIGVSENTIELELQLFNDAQWASIPIKAISTQIPQVLYDSGSNPQRKIYLYPIPNQLSAIRLWTVSQLLNFTTLDDQITLPPGYERALRFGLAVEVAAVFGKTIPDQVAAQALKSKSYLKTSNFVPQYAGLDPALTSTKQSWNWQTGNLFPFR